MASVDRCLIALPIATGNAAETVNWLRILFAIVAASLAST